MSGIIAPCGMDCSECAIYIATKNQDTAAKMDLAKSFTTSVKKFTAEDIHCEGCQSTGKVFITCLECRLWGCLKEKGIQHCGLCGSCPCSLISECMERAPEYKEYLDKVRESHE